MLRSVFEIKARLQQNIKIYEVSNYLRLLKSILMSPELNKKRGNQYLPLFLIFNKIKQTKLLFSQT